MQEYNELEVVWGCAEIGRIIRRTRRQTYALLEKGHIKAATRVGNRYVADIEGLRQQFCPTRQTGEAA